ncbi:hypothetical protein V8C35DRAFT_90077 [Trichoderma chlorosporum]
MSMLTSEHDLLRSDNSSPTSISPQTLETSDSSTEDDFQEIDSGDSQEGNSQEDDFQEIDSQEDSASVETEPQEPKDQNAPMIVLTTPDGQEMVIKKAPPWRAMRAQARSLTGAGRRKRTSSRTNGTANSVAHIATEDPNLLHPAWAAKTPVKNRPRNRSRLRIAVKEIRRKVRKVKSRGRIKSKVAMAMLKKAFRLIKLMPAMRP